MHGQYVTMDGQQIPIYSTQATTAVRECLREVGGVTAVLTEEVKEVVQAREGEIYPNAAAAAAAARTVKAGNRMGTVAFMLD